MTTIQIGSIALGGVGLLILIYGISRWRRKGHTMTDEIREQSKRAYEFDHEVIARLSEMTLEELIVVSKAVEELIEVRQDATAKRN